MKVFSVSHIDVSDPELYKEYVALAPATVAAYGGQYLARNGKKYALEGEIPDKRMVVMEFPSLEKAMAWYNSPEYQEVAKIRHRAAKHSSIILIEGPETLIF